MTTLIDMTGLRLLSGLAGVLLLASGCATPESDFASARAMDSSSAYTAFLTRWGTNAPPALIAEAKQRHEVSRKQERVRSFLLFAVDRGDLDAVRKDLAADPWLVKEKREDGETPLHVAIPTGFSLQAPKQFAEVVDCLIAAGADVNARDSHEWTPLTKACASPGWEMGGVRSFINGQEVVMYDPLPMMTHIRAALVKAGATVNMRDSKGGTALHWAAANGCVEGVRFLLSQGADRKLTATANGQQYTALQLAEMGGNQVVVQLLKDSNK